MGMNISKGNMYEFVTHTWNTVKGRCPHDCSYCYMRRWGKQPLLRFDRQELNTDLGTGNHIFVGSSCDLFADAIHEEWINETMKHCCRHENRYLFQTKNPERYAVLYPHGFPPASMLCLTIETNREYPQMGIAPSPTQRAKSMRYINSWNYRYETMVTVEPIMDFDLEPMVELLKMCSPAQVNIGADSGNNKLPEPHIEKVHWLVDRLNSFTRVVTKKNLERLVAAKSMSRPSV